MGFFDGLRAGLDQRYPAVTRAPATGAVASRPNRRPATDASGRPTAQPPGGFTYSTPTIGGPAYVDAYQSRRAPSPWQLVEKYRGLDYAMVQRNARAVSRIPLRLYADGSRVQGGPPRRACDPIRVSRHVGSRLAEAGMVSPAAVDQVFEVRNHPLLDVLNKPDPYRSFSRKQLIALMVAYMDVVGQAFLVPEGNGWDWKDERQSRKKGPPEYLWVLYSQHIIPFREYGSNIVRYWQYFRDRIPYEAALWFRHSFSIRDPYGSAYSPTYAGDLYFDQEERFSALWDQVLGIGPRPNVIASAKDPMNPPGEAERKRFEHDMRRRHAAGNAGGLLVLNGAYDIREMDYAKADIGAKEINEYSRCNAATIMGQPPTYYTTDTNLANLQAADEQYARNGVEPRCDTVAEVFTHVAQEMDPRLFFKFDPALPEDDEKRARVIDMKLKNASLTINQANEEERWPAVPWGDQPWMAGTLRQPDQIQAQHEQSLATAQQGIETAQAGIEQGNAAMESQAKRDDFELQEPADEAERALLADRDFLTLTRTLLRHDAHDTA